MKFKSDIEVQAGLKDSAGGSGTSGQVLSTTGTSVSWVDPSTLPAVSAKNLITEVWNETGETLTKGTVVYINNGHGNLPTITKALATSDATSAQTYGVVQADITNNNNGWVVVIGILIDLDTQIYAAGTQLYLSSTAAGAWTSTKQYAPAHLVYVGIVVRSHPTQGVVEIKIQNGYEMDELHNVSAQSPNNNAILQYKTSTSLWTSVDGTTSNIAEGSNLYYLDSRARAALSFTAGSGAYNSTTGVITIPTNTNQLTNGSNFITLASLSGTAPIGYNNATGIISITQAGTSSNGYLSSTDWTTFNNKQNALTNPVTGTGNAGYIPKFNGGSSLNNSTIQDSGLLVTITNATKFIGLNTIQGTTASDTAPLGAELTTTATGTNWTGTSFATGYTHTVGSTVALTSTLAASIGTYYQITYTITGRTAGSITIYYGGTTTSGITTTGNTGPLATATTVLSVTPTTDFDGTLVLSIKTIGTSNATTTFTTSGGVVSNEIRASSSTTNYFSGAYAGRKNTTGFQNTFVGYNSGMNNTTGNFNTAIGTSALVLNSIGINNVSIGSNSMPANTTGTGNSVIGTNALTFNNIGSNNSILGYAGLYNNTNGSNNIAIGYNSGRYIADKSTSATILHNSVLLGFLTSPLADNQTNQIVIGYNSTGLGSNTTVLGNSSTVTTAIYGDLLLGGTTDNGTDKLQVTGSANITGQLKLGSTITNGTFTYTLPGATGTLALVGGAGVGTVTSVAALTLGTTGTDISSTVANGSTTPVITLNIPTASATNRGALSSTDWTTFNNKQNALTNPVTGTGNAGYIPKFTAGTTIGNSSIYENSGNVGIGTTSPSYKLTVRNDVAASTSLDQASIGLYNNSDGGSAIYFSNAVGGQSKLSFGVESTGAGSDDTYLGFSTGANTSLSEHMRITSGGNVGIGTTSPASKLNVSGDNITVSAGYGIAYAGDQTRIFTPEDNVSGGLLNWGSGGILRFKSGTSERMRIDGSGNVGIGTTSPASIGGFTTLAVNGSTGGLFDLMSGGTTYGRFYSLTNNLIVEAVGTSNIQFAANATERMRITSGGNVGIGTTSPTRKLSIQDTSFLTAFFGSSFVSGTKYYSSVLVGYQDTVVNRSAQFGYTYDSVTEANSFAHITPFGSSEGSVFMVRADGRVGIGTTSASEKLTVQDSGAGSLLRLNNTAATWSSTMVYGTTTATSGGFDFIGMYANGAAKFNVSSTGVVTASGGFFNSDIRLKNLIDYKYNVESIKPITYIWKDSEDKKRKIGYSAQEVQKILPEAVKEDKEGFLSVDYIQILVAKIAELENRIKQLEK